MDFDIKKPITLITILDIAFVFFLILSGMFEGVLSTVIYFLAFIIPIFIGFYFTKENNKHTDYVLKPGIGEALPVIAPTLGVIMLLAYLTSLLIGALTGKTNSVDLGDNVVTAVLLHAAAPAVLEEALFRYIPMRALKNERPLMLILYSSIFFGIIHHSFFSLPYAVFAGAVFMLIDLFCESVWPSVVIHFLNNLFSVLWYFYGESKTFTTVFISALVMISILSIVYFVIKREKYISKIKNLLSAEGCRFEIGAEAWILILPMLALAVMELI